MKKLLQRIQQSLPVQRLGVAVSGGADSVALLRLLCQVREETSLQMTVLHVDHALRSESKKDADWVKQLADSLGLPFASVRLQKPTSRELAECGIEAWARGKRLAALSLMAEENTLEAVCLGHHAQDQTETILMRLLRGTSLQGLGGLRARKTMKIDGRPLLLWRPLLNISPEALKSFLREIGQEWREDPMNRETRFLRNRVRQKLLPLLENLCPRSLEHVRQVGEDVHAAQRLLKKKAERLLIRSGPGTLRVSPRLPVVLLSELLRQWWIREMGDLSHRFDRSLCDHLVDLVKQNKCGRRVEILGESIVRTREGLAFLIPESSSEKSEFPVTPGISVTYANDEFVCVTDPALAFRDGVWVSPDLFSVPLEWRKRRAGDFFRPATSGGRKKLSRWLIDRKISRHERDTLLLLVCGTEVLWIPGYERSALTSQTYEKGFWFLGRIKGSEKKNG